VINHDAKFPSFMNGSLQRWDEGAVIIPEKTYRILGPISHSSDRRYEWFTTPTKKPSQMNPASRQPRSLPTERVCGASSAMILSNLVP
jgi:hypothetical protein